MCTCTFVFILVLTQHPGKDQELGGSARLQLGGPTKSRLQNTHELVVGYTMFIAENMIWRDHVYQIRSDHVSCLLPRFL